MAHWLSLLVLIGTSFSARAMETDSFTGWFEPLEDASMPLNKIINSRIQDVVDILNSKPKPYCDESKALDALSASLGGSWFKGTVEMEIEKSLEIPKQFLKFKNTVYSKMKIWEGIVNVLRVSCCSPVIDINSIRIGTDKVGHFFQEGWGYYKIVHRKGGTLDDALLWGIGLENGIWGKPFTGIASNGDLAANYGGYLFWSQVFGEQNPYLSCQDGQYSQVRPFDIRDYTDPSWDEAINCSYYGTASLKQKIQRELAKLTSKAKKSGHPNQDYRCPMVQSQCTLLRNKYGPIASRLLSDECI